MAPTILRPRLTMTMAPFPLISERRILRSCWMLLKRRLAAGLLRIQIAWLADWCRSLSVSPICRVLLLDSAGVGRFSCIHLSLMLISAPRRWVTVGTVVKKLVVLLTGRLSILVTAPFPQRILRALWPHSVLRYLVYGMQMLGRKPTLTCRALLFAYVLYWLFPIPNENWLGVQLWTPVLLALVNKCWTRLKMLAQAVGPECGACLTGFRLIRMIPLRPLILAIA